MKLVTTNVHLRDRSNFTKSRFVSPTTMQPPYQQQALVIIRDLYGKVTWDGSVWLDPERTYTVSLPASLTDGLYHLEVITAGEIIASSFIKTH